MTLSLCQRRMSLLLCLREIITVALLETANFAFAISGLFDYFLCLGMASFPSSLKKKTQPIQVFVSLANIHFPPCLI